MAGKTPLKATIFPPKPRRRPVLYRLDDQTYGVLNMRDYRERHVRNLFKYGQPEPDEPPLATGHPRAKQRKRRKYFFAQNRAWAESPGDGVTLLMDSAEAIRQAKISRWKIGRYDAVQNLIQFRNNLPDGTLFFEELAKGTLRGGLNYVAYA